MANFSSASFTNTLFIQDELEESVTLMAKIGACWSPSFSPNGEQVALISNLNGIPQVWIVPTAGGWPQLVTALPDQILAVSWSPAGDWLAFLLAPGGGMNQQVYLVRPDGRDLHRITAGGQENNWLGPWSHDGSRLVIASNQRRPEAMDAYLYDLASNRLHLVAQNQGIGTLVDLSRDGRYALLYRMVNRSDDNLYLLDLENRRETLLTPHDGPGSFDNGRFAKDGRSIYLSGNTDRERTAFCRITLDEQDRPGPITVLAARDDAELQEFALSKDGESVFLIWNSAGSNELAFFDLSTNAGTPGPQLPAEIASSPDFAPDGNRVSFVLSGSATPMDIFVYDRHQKQIWPVTHSPHPGVQVEQFIRPRLVRFPAHDGLELSGWLYLPHEFAHPGPLVLSFHGGPEAQERPTFKYLYQALLAQGIAVLAPNVRGSAGFGKSFVNLDNGPLRFNAVRDIKSCVNFVITEGLADSRRVGIMGGSYGGFMTMAGLTDYPDLFAAGANLFGIVNFETFFAHTEPWMAEISKIQYGDPETQRELLRELSPIHKIDRVQAATIVLHGANDTNVPVVEAEQVVENLNVRGVPVKYVLFPDEGHGFYKEANRIRSAVEIVRWFVTYL